MIVKAFRPINLLAVVLLQSLCFYIGGTGTTLAAILHIILPTVLTAAAGYIINDHYDKRRDEANQKAAPKVNLGSQLFYYYFGLNIVALVLAFLDSLELFEVVLAIQVTLWFYSKYMSSIALMGNLMVALLSCFTILIFYFSQSVSIHIENIWVAIVAIFLVSMARELIKDIEDYDGDKLDEAQTLPIITSKVFTHIFADLFVLCNLVFIGAWTFYDFYLDDTAATIYGVSIVLIGIFIIAMGHFLNKEVRYKSLSNALKVYMFLGMGILFFLKHV